MPSNDYARAVPGQDSSDSSWARIPGPPELTTEKIWHYTNTAGLLGILENDALWATTARMLNDRSEIQYGVELLAVAVEELLLSGGFDEQQRDYVRLIQGRSLDALDTNEVFVICASHGGDDLGQWRGYSAGGGYGIAIDTLAVLGARMGEALPSDEALPSGEALLSDERFLWRNSKEPAVEWRPVVYEPAEQRSILNQVVQHVAAWTPISQEETTEELRHRRMVAMVLGTVARLKHPGFASEREVRLVIVGERFQPFARFRAAALGPTAYLEVVSMIDLMHHGLTLNGGPKMFPLPITEIRVGPAQDQDAAEAAVRTLLKSMGRDSIPVTRSMVPYR